MEMVNRSVAIIKPKEPLVEWVNRHLDMAPPLAMDELEHDRTAYLIPELGSTEAALDYLEPLKPLLFEVELEDWSRDPDIWPPKLTSELFDAWFAIEVHSVVWDIGDVPLEKEEGIPLNISGAWDIVAGTGVDQDDLYREPPPRLRLWQEGEELSGDLLIGPLAGTLVGRMKGESVLFSFVGTNGDDPVNGAGTLLVYGEPLVVEMLLHSGEAYVFECEWAEEVV